MRPLAELEGVEELDAQVAAGVGVSTLPLQIYSMIKIAVTPEVNAISTLLMLLTLSLVGLAARLDKNIMRVQ